MIFIQRQEEVTQQIFVFKIPFEFENGEFSLMLTNLCLTIYEYMKSYSMVVALLLLFMSL